MKPRNFPSRRARRIERAQARREQRSMPREMPHITDIKVRMGAKKRTEIVV